MGSNNKGLVPPSADEEYFLAAGQYVANAPHVLISAWDGVDTPAVGGTADTSRDRMNMRPLRIDPLSLEAVMEECKLLMVVPTRREGEQVRPRCPTGWYGSRSVGLDRRPQFQNARGALKSLELFDDAAASIDAANRKVVVAADDLGQLFEVAENLAPPQCEMVEKELAAVVCDGDCRVGSRGHAITGCWAFHSAAASIAGIYSVHMIHKGRNPADGTTALHTFAALAA